MTQIAQIIQLVLEEHGTDDHQISAELDRNEVLVEVQHGTLKDIAESIGVELHLSEDN